MPGWFKQHTSELAALETLLRCGRQDAVLAWLRVTRYTVDKETDELPESMASDLEMLRSLDLAQPYGTRCAELIRHRERNQAYRNKRDITRHHESSSDDTRRHEASRDHLDKTREDKSGEEIVIAPPAEPPAPAKPKRQPKATTGIDGWSPKDDHVAIAKQRGINLDTEVIKMRDWAASKGAKKKDWDAFARNWLRNARIERSAPINLANNLRQPHPREIPTDPEEARKYWLGEQQDEQRFDWG